MGESDHKGGQRLFLGTWLFLFDFFHVMLIRTRSPDEKRKSIKLRGYWEISENASQHSFEMGVTTWIREGANRLQHDGHRNGR